MIKNVCVILMLGACGIVTAADTQEMSRRVISAGIIYKEYFQNDYKSSDLDSAIRQILYKISIEEATSLAALLNRQTDDTTKSAIKRMFFEAQRARNKEFDELVRAKNKRKK